MNDRFNTWKQKNDEGSLNELITSAKPVIDSALKTYVGFEDPAARSHAKVLASRAFKSYDSTKGTQLRTHLLTQMQPLRRFASRRRNVLKIPERVQYDLGALQEAEAELRDTLDRDPSDIETADHTGLSASRIQHIRKFANRPVSSTYQSETGIGGEPKSTGAMDAWTDYVYHDLPATDRKIMEWRTGYGGSVQLSNNEIAKRLRLTPGAVTQRASRIAQILEQGIR